MLWLCNHSNGVKSLPFTLKFADVTCTIDQNFSGGSFFYSKGLYAQKSWHVNKWYSLFMDADCWI
jgi:hypothetical protein